MGENEAFSNHPREAEVCKSSFPNVYALEIHHGLVVEDIKFRQIGRTHVSPAGATLMPSQLVLSWKIMVDQMNEKVHLWGIGKKNSPIMEFFQGLTNLKCQPCVYLCGKDADYGGEVTCLMSVMT